MPVHCGSRWTPLERSRRHCSVAALLLFGCASGPVCAQELAELPSAPLPRPGLYGVPQATGAAQATGILSGVVVDPHSALIPNAQVTLSPSGAPVRTATSGGDGSFQFSNVPAGAFRLSVSAPGFEPASAAGTLLPGQSFVMEPISLPIETVAVQVEAMTQEQAALEELHQEEHQRILGALPNFFVSYRWDAPPLSSKQKFELSWRNASDLGNLALVGTVAGVQQAADAFPGYHQGLKGYGKRYGADLANLWIGTFMGGAVLPSLFHQDPRYFYKGTGTKKSRFLYAISTSVICRGDNGHRQPAFASVLGDLSAGAISNAYYPASDRQGARLTLINGFLGIGGDAMNNVIQEFLLHKVTTGANKSAQQ